MATIAQGVGQVQSENPGVGTAIGQGGTYKDYSPDTRQLIVDSAGISTGDRGLGSTPDAQSFIKNGSIGGRYGQVGGASAPGASGYGGTSGGTGSSSLLDYVNSRYSSLLSGSPRSEQQIMADKAAEIQKAVDQINNVYAYRVGDAQQTGARQAARTGAMNNASGVAYTPMGEANLKNTESDTARILAQILADQAKASGDVYSKYADNAQTQANFETGRYDQNTQSYLAALQNAFGQQQSANQFSQTFGLQERQLAQQVADAQKKNYSIVQGDDGTILAINPNDPTDKYVVGKYNVPRSGGSGGAAAYIAPLGSNAYDDVILQMINGEITQEDIVASYGSSADDIFSRFNQVKQYGLDQVDTATEVVAPVADTTTQTPQTPGFLSWLSGLGGNKTNAPAGGGGGRYF